MKGSAGPLDDAYATKVYYLLRFTRPCYEVAGAERKCFACAASTNKTSSHERVLTVEVRKRECRDALYSLRPATMYFIRLLPLRALCTGRLSAHCLRAHSLGPRTFTTTHVRAGADTPFSEPAMQALRDSKLGQAIFSNPELQQVVMEMWEISKEEGKSHFTFSREDGCRFTEVQASTRLSHRSQLY